MGVYIKKTIFIIFSIYLIVFRNTIIFADDITSVPAPCLKENQMNNPRLDLQACSYVLSKDRNDSLINIVSSYYKKYIQCYYEGYIINNESKSCKDGNPSNGNPTLPKKIVCSIQDGEIQKNNLGENCGSFETVGLWEKAQSFGLRVQGIKFFRDQILFQEISQKNILKVSLGCQAIAADYLSLNQTAKNISDHVTTSINSGLPSVVYNGGVNFCSNANDVAQIQKNEQNMTSDEIDMINAIPKSVACYLGISRTNRELLFSRLIQCEILQRLNIFETNYKIQSGDQIKKIVQQCLGPAISEGESVGKKYFSTHPLSGESEARRQGEVAGQAKFNQCYEPLIKQFFLDTVKTYIPGKFKS